MECRKSDLKVHGGIDGIDFSPKTFEKLLKPHRFHVFVAYINACLRDQFKMRHRDNK